jgi:hypothetical protein
VAAYATGLPASLRPEVEPWFTLCCLGVRQKYRTALANSFLTSEKLKK